jgi:mono/diheme cytochrome c family protein
VAPILLAVIGINTAHALNADDAAAVKVQLLLKQKCAGCHGDDPKDVGGQLDLRTREGLFKPAESGDPAIVEGNAQASRLYQAILWTDESLQMPPQERNRLKADEVELVKRWIDAGAKWPDAETAKAAAASWSDASGTGGITVATSGGRSDDWTNRRYQPADIWAYLPITRPTPPSEATLDGAIQNPIDAFLRAKLKAKGLTPAAQADRRTLVRRATFDLTGLPPSPEEMERFVNASPPSLDPSVPQSQKDGENEGQRYGGKDQAYHELIQSLLASPQYGEQMARHWLDVTRYADTNGFSNDYERPNAWRWRDYVVRSFNADKPFDRFVLEQLAGDELAPDDAEARIATGFLRCGPWEHTGMTVAAITRQQYLDDVTNHVGVSLLGQGLRCASCHDHKFDPVPTKDYYRLQAVFSSTQFSEQPTAFLAEENVQGFDAGRAMVERRLAEAEELLESLNEKNKKARAEYLKEHGVDDFSKLTKEQRAHSNLLGLSKTDLSLRKINEKRKQYFERELKRYEPFAFTVYSGPTNNYTSVKPLSPKPKQRMGDVPDVFILAGGSLESPGEQVTPGVLSAAYESNDVTNPTSWNTIPSTTEGRRLALARWIASDKNPLPARVIVNRVWQWHFGRGLVATPNNFGKMGAKPTHPELLDYLATWFIDNGWSLKKLHVLIMTSEAYQQAGEPADAERVAELDARNELLSYFPPRRLSAEEMRDAMLAVTGELNREMGGPGVFPEINWEVAFQPRHIMGSVAPAYQPSRTPRERNRRTLYAFRYRTLADPMLEVFNRPGSETSCERRDETTVTPQVFALFNSEFALDRAIALAAEVTKSEPTTKARVARAFRLVYGRAATDVELSSCEAHVSRMAAYHRDHVPGPVKLPTSVKRHMVEEMTGEPVEWEESLDGLADYQSDLKPWDVDAETRALADVCLVLLNSNEFLYVR